MSDPPRPILGLSGAEGARILGIHEVSVARLVRQGVLHKPAGRQQYALDRDEVEQLALDRYTPGPPYWLTSAEAGEVLGLTPTSVNRLARAGKIPAVRHGRRWLYRRHQVEVLANARAARLDQSLLRLVVPPGMTYRQADDPVQDKHHKK